MTTRNKKQRCSRDLQDFLSFCMKATSFYIANIPWKIYIPLNRYLGNIWKYFTLFKKSQNKIKYLLKISLQNGTMVYSLRLFLLEQQFYNFVNLNSFQIIYKLDNLWFPVVHLREFLRRLITLISIFVPREMTGCTHSSFNETYTLGDIKLSKSFNVS